MPSAVRASPHDSRKWVPWTCHPPCSATSADETSALVAEQGGWHVHGTHFLESWGDARTADGMLVPVQPMILPLFNGVSEIEFLARLSGDSVTEGYSLVHRTVSA